MMKHSSALKIMPLGDSLTDGYYFPGGYRVSLWQKLTKQGYSIEFVGSLQNGPPELGDRHHEGHSGWTIREIQHLIRLCLPRFSPDIILLLIGTNDMVEVDRAENAPQALQTLIQTIFDLQPTVKLLIGSIPPIADGVYNLRVKTYNSAIADMIQNHQNQGQIVSFVDLYSGLDWDDLVDGVHPTEHGLHKMGVLWSEALLELLNYSR